MSASEWFGEGDRRAAAEAVAAAERKTSGEIVPVVATRSGTYERAEDLVGLGLVLVASWLAVFLPHGVSLLLVLPAALFAAFWGGVLVARACPPLVRLLAAGRMEEEVSRAAAQSFETFHARGTKAKTGIVIYVSLFEHAVCVQGDEAISARITPEQWDAIAGTIVEGIRAGRPGEGLVRGIAQAGALLAEHFPVEAGDTNELTNELRLID